VIVEREGRSKVPAPAALRTHHFLVIARPSFDPETERAADARPTHAEPPAAVQDLADASPPRTPMANTLEPPSWLPAEGNWEWKRVLEATKRYPHWLQQADRAVLTAYCATWPLFFDAAQ
jgi:phage terminase small subunit